MGKLIKEGKIRGWEQSSSTADQIRKAHDVTPITAIQSEYSMMGRKWEKVVLPLCKELTGLYYIWKNMILIKPSFNCLMA